MVKLQSHTKGFERSHDKQHPMENQLLDYSNTFFCSAQLQYAIFLQEMGQTHLDKNVRLR